MHELIKRPHPALVHFPVSLFPVSLIFLVLYWTLNNLFFLVSSFWTFMLGAAFVVPVAITGFLDMHRLKNESRTGNRLIGYHLANGMIITVLTITAGLYFFFNPPMVDLERLSSYAAVVAISALLVAIQGYMGAVMVYQQHLGIDGDTR